jgi:hypothetical protein
MEFRVPMAALLSAMGCADLGADDQPGAASARRDSRGSLGPSAFSLRNDTLALPAALKPILRPEPEALLCPAPRVLFLNFDGASLHGNSDCSDALANCTFIVNGSLNFPGFAGSTSAKQQIIDLVTGYFAPFNVSVVTARPQSGVYEMSMIGGQPALVGVTGAAGLAPLDCGDRNATDISFAFASSVDNVPHAVAVTVAQEAAHGLGLGHVDDASDIMYPALSSQADRFHDREMPIYDIGGPSSDCTGTGMQNDVSLLNQNVGARCSDGGGSGGASGGGAGGTGGAGGMPDMTGPRVRIAAPQDGQTVQPAFSAQVVASDDEGAVSRVDLLADGTQLQILTSPPWQFSIAAGQVTTGGHHLIARASDVSGNLAYSLGVYVIVAEQPGATGRGLGEACANNDDCASHECAQDGATGRRFCTEQCSLGCPSGFGCDHGYCVAASGGDGAANGPHVNGGCTMVSDSERLLPRWVGVAALAFLLCRVRRWR